MRNILLASVAVATLAGPADAIANVIYTFESPITSLSGPPRTLPDLSITLELTEAGSSFGIVGGTFPISTPSGGPLEPLVGDVARFVGLTVRTGSTVETVTPTARDSNLALSLTFNSGGNVTSSAFQFRGALFDVSLIGNNQRAEGVVGADRLNCSITAGGSPVCAISGNWRLQGPAVPVPEPMSLALFAMGLAGLGMVRRKQSA